MAATFNRVRIQGTIVGGEVWSVNPAFGLTGATGSGSITEFAELQTWAVAIAALHGGHVVPDGIFGLLSSAVTINSVRCENLTNTGELLQAAEYTLPTPARSTNDPNKTPQTAMVASLQSGRPGRSFNGRIYWPALGINLTTSTLRLSASNTELFAGETADWLRDICDASTAPETMNPVIASFATASQAEVKTVRVGDVLDTQRRRRDAYKEQYSQAVVTG